MGELKGRSISIFVVTVVFLALSFVAVSLRCFARLRLVRAFGWDDSLMVLAMALNIVFAICGITGSFYGMGRRMEDLIDDIPGVEKALFWWWLGQASYVFTCVIAKMSIALTLLRLTISRGHQAIIWTVVGVSVVVGLAFWFTLILQCHPVSFFWHRFTSSGTCINLKYLEGVAYLYSVTAVICDFILALLPIALVWKLQMNFRTKAALAAILGLGCIASTAVIIRIPYLHYYRDDDFLYATTDISIWSNVEASLGITAGSLVTVRSLFRFFRGSGNEESGSRAASDLPLSRMDMGMNMNGATRTRSGQEETDDFWWLEVGVEPGLEGTRSTTQISTSQICGQEDLKHIGGTLLTSSRPSS